MTNQDKSENKMENRDENREDGYEEIVLEKLSLVRKELDKPNLDKQEWERLDREEDNLISESFRLMYGLD